MEVRWVYNLTNINDTCVFCLSKNIWHTQGAAKCNIYPLTTFS